MRAELLAGWLAEQGLEAATVASFMQQSMQSSGSSTVVLADGRHKSVSFGPKGVVPISPSAHTPMAQLNEHIAWACVLGNGVDLSSCPSLLERAIRSIKIKLQAVDPVLDALVSCTFSEEHAQVPVVRLVVSPSADLEALVDHVDALRSSAAVVLWVNHALHHEVCRRLPDAQLVRQLQSSASAAGIYIEACGDVQQQLIQLCETAVQQQGVLALYSNDWGEVRRCSAGVAARSVDLWVNTVQAAPMVLEEARLAFQQPVIRVTAGDTNDLKG